MKFLFFFAYLKKLYKYYLYSTTFKPLHKNSKFVLEKQLFSRKIHYPYIRSKLYIIVVVYDAITQTTEIIGDYTKQIVNDETGLNLFNQKSVQDSAVQVAK